MIGCGYNGTPRRLRTWVRETAHLETHGAGRRASLGLRQRTGNSPGGVGGARGTLGLTLGTVTARRALGQEAAAGYTSVGQGGVRDPEGAGNKNVKSS